MSKFCDQRGSDIPHSPVMYAYLIVEIAGAKLFVDEAKITPEVMNHLKNAGVELRPYESILSGIERYTTRSSDDPLFWLLQVLKAIYIEVFLK